MPKGYPKKRAARAIEVQPRHMWTKEDIKELLEMWDTCTKKEMMDRLGVNESQLNTMAIQIRKAGYPLAKKTTRSVHQLLVTEVLKELKLIR